MNLPSVEEVERVARLADSHGYGNPSVLLRQFAACIPELLALRGQASPQSQDELFTLAAMIMTHIEDRLYAGKTVLAADIWKMLWPLYNEAKANAVIAAERDALREDQEASKREWQELHDSLPLITARTEAAVRKQCANVCRDLGNEIVGRWEKADCDDVLMQNAKSHAWQLKMAAAAIDALPPLSAQELSKL